MAVEDHPKFPEWRDALDEMKAAADDLVLQQNMGDTDAMLKPPRDRLRFAIARYNSISAEIDADK